MKPVTITNMTFSEGPSNMLFRLKCNGIELSVSCPLKDFKDPATHDKTMEKVNENFRNSIRYIKLHGDLPAKPDKKKLNVWTQTDTGIAIRGNKMQVPEFTPFSFA